MPSMPLRVPRPVVTRAVVRAMLVGAALASAGLALPTQRAAAQKPAARPPQVTVTAWEPNGGEVTQVVSPCDGRPVELRLEGQRAPLPLRKDGSLYKDYAP